VPRAPPPSPLSPLSLSMLRAGAPCRAGDATRSPSQNDGASSSGCLRPSSSVCALLRVLCAGLVVPYLFAGGLLSFHMRSSSSRSLRPIAPATPMSMCAVVPRIRCFGLSIGGAQQPASALTTRARPKRQRALGWGLGVGGHRCGSGEGANHFQRGGRCDTQLRVGALHEWTTVHAIGNMLSAMAAYSGPHSHSGLLSGRGRTQTVRLWRQYTKGSGTWSFGSTLSHCVCMQAWTRVALVCTMCVCSCGSVITSWLGGEIPCHSANNSRYPTGSKPPGPHPHRGARRDTNAAATPWSHLRSWCP